MSEPPIDNGNEKDAVKGTETSTINNDTSKNTTGANDDLARDPEKVDTTVGEGSEQVQQSQPTPRVVFGDEERINESEKEKEKERPRGPEMRREMTKEEKELAAAGYGHLERVVTGAKGKTDVKEDLDKKVDIIEHKYPISQFNEKLQTDINAKDPASSNGLTNSEAAARLARDGKNILTPPKKKSALRKVRP